MGGEDKMDTAGPRQQTEHEERIQAGKPLKIKIINSEKLAVNQIPTARTSILFSIIFTSGSCMHQTHGHTQPSEREGQI